MAMLKSRQGRILNADCSAMGIEEHVDTVDHLTPEEQDLLKRMLKECVAVFQGGLGTLLNMKPIHPELKDGAKPHHARPFPTPKACESATKKELERLCAIGALKKCHNSNWAAPTFINQRKQVTSAF